LKALRRGAWKGSKLVWSPLSVATISPGPESVNVSALSARGAVRPAASVTRTVTKARSRPSARIVARSGLASSAAGACAVFMVSVAQRWPFL